MADDLDADNLEDGEQWLPSDFFSIDEIQTSTKFSYSSSSPNPSRTAEEESYQCFFASTSLQRHPNYRHLCKPLPNLQRINPAVSYGTVGVSGGGDPCECKTGNIRTGCSPGYRFGPVQTQNERFIGERAMAVLHLHQRQQRTRFSVNRVFSVVGMGPGHVGTGVFLPRTALLTKNSNIHHNLRKGPRSRNNRVDTSYKATVPLFSELVLTTYIQLHHRTIDSGKKKMVTLADLYVFFSVLNCIMHYAYDLVSRVPDLVSRVPDYCIIGLLNLV